MTQREREQLRWMCQTDLFFLAHDVLNYSQMTIDTHWEMCDFYMHKDPRKGLYDQDEEKRRLMLAPRYGYKSTINICDTIQLFLCFANIRICAICGDKPLAQAFVDEVQTKFILDPDCELTLIQELFPEYCIKRKDVYVGKFTVPCRTMYWKEPTLWATSIESTLSGWHCDVMKPDDVVNNLNSQNGPIIQKVNDNFELNLSLLHPRGYVDMNGTRYGVTELYGLTIKQAKPGQLKMFHRAAWTPNQRGRARLAADPMLDPNYLDKEDYDLWFPELLTYEFLCEKRDKNFRNFASQYLNDPIAASDPTFMREKILQATVPDNQAPAFGEIKIAWRFACPSKEKLNSTAAAVAMMDDKRMFIVDVVHGSFKPSKLAYKVVDLARTWGTHEISIEETPGAKFLENAIQNYALTMDWAVNIQWTPFEEDDGARELRMKQLEPLINTMRVLFLARIKNLEEIYDQFTQFLICQDFGLVDVISRLAGFLPATVAAGEPDAWQKEWAQIQDLDQHDLLYGRGKYAPVEPAPEEYKYEPVNVYGLPDMLGGLDG